ncbi:MAG TPA: GntR family transcriptional regulator, partial [Nevskia sp.]|nr:GntR family transcriptional regulator [Nevskia sp.]
MLLQLGDTGPLYRRIYQALRQAILEGGLKAGARLPGSRSLARDLGVSRIVVLAAFEQLAAEGYIVSSVGSGSRVAVQVPRMAPPRAADAAKPASRAAPALTAYGRRARALAPHAPSPLPQRAAGLVDFYYAGTTPDPRTLRLWRQALSRAAASSETGYPDPAGSAVLRLRLAAYLREQRGVQ